jgi:hypothetical protein
LSVRTAVEQLAEPIGKEIGMADDHTQAALLNGFAGMMKAACGREIETQLCWISDKLSPAAKDVIVRLARFCELPS